MYGFKTLMTWFVLLAVIVFWGMVAHAQVPGEVSNLTLGGTFAQSGEDLNLGFIGGVPLDFMGGHFAWYVQRDTSGAIVLSETLNAHLEGGYKWRGWELVAFVDGLRDIDRGLQEAKTGYAVEVPEVSFGRWQGTVGAGNAARSRDALAAQTGLDGKALDAAVVSRWTEPTLVCLC